MPIGSPSKAQITAVNDDGTFHIRMMNNGQRIQNVPIEKITNVRGDRDRWWLQVGSYCDYHPDGAKP